MSEQRKVAFFYFFLASGGIERSFIQIANTWSKKWPVEFMVMSRTGALTSLVDPRVSIHSFHLTPKRIFHHFVLIFRMASHLRAAGYTHIITGNPAANITVILARFLSFRRMKLVISEHGDTLTWLRGRKENFLIKLAVISMIRLLYRCADVVIAVSYGLRENLAKVALLDINRIDVAYNPVVSDDLLKKSKLDPRHKWLGRGAKVPVIVTVGRLEPMKDHATLLEAFSLLRKKRKARLIIIGEGQELGATKSLIKKLRIGADVDLPGFKNNPYAYMARAAMFVLSSDTEGLPTALIEGMACGTQLVSTDAAPGVREILENGKYGQIVPIKDPAALAAAMEKSLKKEFFIAQKDLKKRSNAFTVKKAVQEYEKLCFN